MIKYWLLANEKGTINIQIMHSLANYYNKEKDYDNMKKFLLKAIEEGSKYAIKKLGIFIVETDNGENSIFLLEYFNEKKKTMLELINKTNDDAYLNIYNIVNNFIINEGYDNIIKKYYLKNIKYTNNKIGLGLYYKMKKDYINMKKYLLKAVNKGNKYAMHILGNHYKIQEDYNNMKKYYLMAIDRDYDESMYQLGNYYEKQKDYDNMKKYYLMAIDKGDTDAMHNLAEYYKQQKDYDNMKKYYLIAINKDSTYAMHNLADYYKEQKDYDNMKKYYLMAIDKDDTNSMYSLGLYYKRQGNYNFMKKYYLMAINRGNTNAMFNLGFHYSNIEMNDSLKNKYYNMCKEKSQKDNDRIFKIFDN